MKKNYPAPKAVLAYSLMREKDTNVWHRPTRYGEPHCGARIGSPERMSIEVEHWPPADQELCQRCNELFNEESRRALRRAFDILLEAALRHKAEQQTTGEENV